MTRRKYHRQSERTVRVMRALRFTVPQDTLARVFNTCKSNVSYIQRRVTWP